MSLLALPPLPPRAPPGELSAMSAMMGGLVGQEVVKAVSGKFHPIFQWFYFDSVESMPSEILPAEEYEPLGTRCVWGGGGHQACVCGEGGEGGHRVCLGAGFMFWFRTGFGGGCGGYRVSGEG